MSDLAWAAGSPLPVSIGGKTFLLSPLTIGDLGTIEAKAEHRVKDRLKSDLGLYDDHSSAEAKKLIADALELIRSGRATQRFIVSPAGTALMVWLSIRHQQPQVTLEDVEALLTWRDIEKVQTALDQISLPESAEKFAGGGSPRPNPAMGATPARAADGPESSGGSSPDTDGPPPTSAA